jgi:hypothetical protein
MFLDIIEITLQVALCANIPRRNNVMLLVILLVKAPDTVLVLCLGI